MDIVAGLNAIKQTVDFAKELRNVYVRIGEADLKLRVAEMVDRLLDAKQALVDAQEREHFYLKKISQLEAALAEAGRFKDRDGLLFEISEDGSEIGEPFCNLCFVKEKLRLRMRLHDAHSKSGAFYQCDHCKTLVRIGPPPSRPPFVPMPVA